METHIWPELHHRVFWRDGVPQVFVLGRIDFGQKLVGGWATPLKNISQLGWLFPIYGTIQNVPNYQAEKLIVTHKTFRSCKYSDFGGVIASCPTLLSDEWILIPSVLVSGTVPQGYSTIQASPSATDLKMQKKHHDIYPHLSTERLSKDQHAKWSNIPLEKRDAMPSGTTCGVGCQFHLPPRHQHRTLPNSSCWRVSHRLMKWLQCSSLMLKGWPWQNCNFPVPAKAAMFPIFFIYPKTSQDLIPFIPQLGLNVGNDTASLIFHDFPMPTVPRTPASADRQPQRFISQRSQPHHHAIRWLENSK